MYILNPRKFQCFENDQKINLLSSHGKMPIKQGFSYNFLKNI